MDYTKAQKRRLRDLLAEAHKRDLSFALDRLSGFFRRWKSGEMTCFELDEQIHLYHQHDARTLWLKYERSTDPAMAVVVLAGVVRSGTMGLAEIPDDLRANVAAVMDSLPEDTRSPSDGDGEPSASDIAGTQGH